MVKDLDLGVVDIVATLCERVLVRVVSSKRKCRIQKMRISYDLLHGYYIQKPPLVLQVGQTKVENH